MSKIFFILLAVIFVFGCQKPAEKSIQPLTENPWYWQFNGKPVLLLGASSDDNLFQWAEEMLVPHLDSMHTVGANYVRNTMSDRKNGGFELYPFKEVEEGNYDLNQWNSEYWLRFENFLNETARRDIIVQIEIWDRFDYSRENWPPHPYNPKNNINYTYEEAGLDSFYTAHPNNNKQPFFFTTPQQNNNEVLLQFQKKFVDKILSYSLRYNHVLYCMDNETSAEKAWAVYWANYVLDKAEAAEKKVCVTEMWDHWDLKSEQHKRTLDNPDLFAFCDVSQNNHQRDQTHWDNFQWVRNYISGHPRPINIVKTYGADGGAHGTTNNAIDSWWRHLLGGAATVRFHRPTAGLGLTTITANSIKTAREIEKVVNFWDIEPSNDLLLQREENEAYLASKPGETYVVFFTDGGEVSLDLTQFNADFLIQWYNIREGEMVKQSDITGGKKINLKTPGTMEWIALLHKK